MRHASKTGRKTAEKGSFAGIPRRLMETEDFKGLSTSAVTILLELAYQYRGRNNGDLCATFGYMKKRGIRSIRSKVTLSKALRELEGANLIIKTRQGRFMNPGGTCDLWALAWLPIDDCGGKLEMGPTITPPRKLSLA